MEAQKAGDPANWTDVHELLLEEWIEERDGLETELQTLEGAP